MTRDATCLAEQLETYSEVSTPITSPEIEERLSPIHGRGVYALRAFRTGEPITELTGERITAEESDRRAELRPKDGHTWFFWVDEDLVLDCAVNGNCTRYMNHHCDPNCEAIIEDDRVFIYAIRDISPEEELTYDYRICWTGEEDATELASYTCNCGAENCRGTMLSSKPMDPQTFDIEVIDW